MTSAFSTDFPRAHFRTSNICNFLISEQIHIVQVLLDFSLTVKAATLIVISRRGSAISSAKQGKSGSIYSLVKKKISCLGHTNVCAFHENPNRIHTELSFINP